MAKKVQSEQTPGRVRHLNGMGRFFIKPSLGRVLIRKSGVIRRSDKVRAINKKVAANPPAARAKAACLKDHPEFGEVCPIHYFRKYLRKEMEAVVGKGA